jgi:hypothetical protein
VGIATKAKSKGSGKVTQVEGLCKVSSFEQLLVLLLICGLFKKYSAGGKKKKKRSHKKGLVEWLKV